MTLSKEKIEANTKKYFSTAEKYNIMTPELIEFLGVDFISAAASTTNKLYNAFEGGLIDHILRVTKHALAINDLLMESKRVDKTSLIKVSLLHQIGKAKIYKETEKDWQRNSGVLYEFKKNLVSMRISERSIHYIYSHNIKLTEEEHTAILHYDLINDDMTTHYNTVLGDILRMANTMAIMEEKN
jgi:hypothetical protein